MQAARHFGRPVGGEEVVRDLVGYLRASEKLIGLEATADMNRERRGPVDLHPPEALESTLTELMRGYATWRWKVRIKATFLDNPIEIVEVVVRRGWTGGQIAGARPSAVAGERAELHAVLGLTRRLRTKVFTFLMAIVAIASLILAMIHR